MTPHISSDAPGNGIARAKAQSDLARARVEGMKIRAEIDPPRAAVGGFPYAARTCAEWTDDEIDRRFKPRRHWQPPPPDLPPEMSDKERKADAIRGSAALLDALRRAA